MKPNVAIPQGENFKRRTVLMLTGIRHLQVIGFTIQTFL